MRSHVMLAMVLFAGASLLHGQPDQEAMTNRVARLIRQLGDSEFTKREQASKELDAIGAPALPALRQAASGEDAEVRRRAERLIASITGRVRAAVTKKELEKLQGTWIRVAHETNGQRVHGEDHVFTVTGDKVDNTLGRTVAPGGNGCKH